ncbi:MAG: IS1 family transposase, partial [Pseudanabaena sp.]
EGLQRAVTVQRLVHNWVRPHGGLEKNKTPAMEIGLYHRPISMLELLSVCGFHCITY